MFLCRVHWLFKKKRGGGGLRMEFVLFSDEHIPQLPLIHSEYRLAIHKSDLFS